MAADDELDDRNSKPSKLPPAILNFQQSTTTAGSAVFVATKELKL